jgi:hypothetical protein
VPQSGTPEDSVAGVGGDELQEQRQNGDSVKLQPSREAPRLQ